MKKFRSITLSLFVLLFIVSCSGSGENSANSSKDSGQGNNERAGYIEKSNSADPNETLYIPEEISRDLIYSTWGLISIDEAGSAIHNDCDLEREFRFSKTRDGQQSGIPLFTLEVREGDEPCSANVSNTRWNFNPYVENEIIIQQLMYSKGRLTGSFKIVELNSKRMVLHTKEYQVTLDRIAD